MIAPLPWLSNSGRSVPRRSSSRSLPSLDQDHDRGGGGDRLGQRGQVEDRVAGHRLVGRLDRLGGPYARAKAIFPRRPTSTTAPGTLPAGDRRFDRRVDPRQPAGVEAELGRGRLGQAAPAREPQSAARG